MYYWSGSNDRLSALALSIIRLEFQSDTLAILDQADYFSSFFQSYFLTDFTDEHRFFLIR
jgi:hypothetical protein